jgi:phosphate transport system permease protein
LRFTRDDWRAQKPVTKGDRFLLFAFATSEYTADKFRLRWEPDAAYDPVHAAHRLVLRSIQSPPGTPKIEIDLSKQPSGSIELPAWVAKTDAERTQRYRFEVVAEPKYSSGFAATMAGFFRTDWAPTLQYPRFGFVPLILSTLLITCLAILFAAGPALMTAIYLSEMAPGRIREWLKPIIELLASVPTVVLGYFGLMLVAPGVMATIGEALRFESGRSVLTASIMMAVLILPTIISIAEDALRNVPGSLRDGAEALGLTPIEAIKRVTVRAAKPGLISALLFGFARATGETMIVWILGGGTALMPRASLETLGQPTRGIADTIGIEMANVVFEQPHYGHLFLIGLILFGITVTVNLAGHRMSKRVAI